MNLSKQIKQIREEAEGFSQEELSRENIRFSSNNLNWENERKTIRYAICYL